MKIRIIFLALVCVAFNSSIHAYILGSQNQANSVAIQSDGKIVVCGMTIIDKVQQFLVARYTSVGVLDSTFGTNGCQTTVIGDSAVAYGVALDASGNIIVVGASVLNGASSIALTRYTSAGVLDTTFGVNGIVLTAISSGSSGYALVLQSDGKIVVTGSVLQSNEVWIPIVRYNTSGSLDTSFGTNGVTVINIEDCAIGYSLIQQPDGKFIIGGFAEGNAFVVRVNNNGTVDTTFNGTGGISIEVGLSSFIRGTGLQTTGKIIVAGYSNGQTFLARLNTNGTLDTTFGTDGISVNNFSSYNIALDVVVDSSDRIIIAGISSDSPIAARYTSAGVLDATFGVQGLASINCGTAGNTNAITIQSDGKIVLAGLIDNNVLTARLTTSGVLDSTYNGIGYLLDPTDYFPSCDSTLPTSAYAFAYDTTTQTASVANLYQDITISTNATLSNWSHTGGAATFTCGKSGQYLVSYTTSSERTSGSGVVNASLRATNNGTEIPGSQLSFDYATTNQTVPSSKTFVATVVQGDVVKFQFAGASTSCRLISGDGVGTVKPCIAVTFALIS
jgi:uncharacterized delta-60 repeat protein